jgi:hypothetical protein
MGTDVQRSWEPDLLIAPLALKNCDFICNLYNLDTVLIEHIFVVSGKCKNSSHFVVSDSAAPSAAAAAAPTTSKCAAESRPYTSLHSRPGLRRVPRVLIRYHVPQAE